MNKKAQSGETVFWIIRIIGTLIVIGLLVFIINGTIEKSLDIDDLRYYSVAERFLYSRDCFIKIENERAYPGIIDMEKFNEDSLSTCMAPTKATIGAKIVLTQGGEEQTLYYNQEYYEDIKPLSFSNKYMLVGKRYLVLTSDMRPSNMLIEVAWKK